MADQNQRHRMNAPGSFYVVDGCCTSCGVPEASAPEMFAYDPAMHCYVRRQPVSADEVERALQVIRGQELGCIRYCGTDLVILRRLAEAGESSSCDFPLKGAEPVLRNVVTFVVSDGRSMSLQEFVGAMRRMLPGVEIQTKSMAGATLSISWYEGNFHDLILSGLDHKPRHWMISHSGPLGLSEWLQRWLADAPGVDSVRWFTERELRAGGRGQNRPW